MDLLDKLELNSKKNLLFVANIFLDYKSRFDKYEMDIIKDETQITEGKCYILLTNLITIIINNDKQMKQIII